MYEKYYKRILDVILSAFLLIVLLPLIVFLCIVLKLSIGREVFFVQKRIGYKEKEFLLFKYKSMTDQRDQNGVLLPDNVRLTRFGKFLRTTSLDELPQLLNVLKGDMSIIGPRPLLESYLPLYTQEQRRRHDVRPGIVGLAGVNGRNQQSWESKFAYDIFYVNNLSLYLDIEIFFKAIITVFCMNGVDESNETTASAFTGNNNKMGI